MRVGPSTSGGVMCGAKTRAPDEVLREVEKERGGDGRRRRRDWGKCRSKGLGKRESVQVT